MLLCIVVLGMSTVTTRYRFSIATATVVVLGTAVTLALLVASIVDSQGPPIDGPEPVRPMLLGVGAVGVAIITLCAAWTAKAWSNRRGYRGEVLSGVVLTIGVTVAVCLGGLALREAKQRLYKPYCVRDGVAPHHLACNPTGARDYTTAEIHALVVLALAAGVLAATSLLMMRVSDRR